MGEGKWEFFKFNLATAILGGAAQIPKHFLLHGWEVASYMWGLKRGHLCLAGPFLPYRNHVHCCCAWGNARGASAVSEAKASCSAPTQSQISSSPLKVDLHKCIHTREAAQGQPEASRGSLNCFHSSLPF